MIQDPALIVVDVQKDFAKPDYAFGESVEHLDEMIKRTEKFLDRYRNSGRNPIFVRTVHDENTDSPTWIKKYNSEEFNRPCIKNTEGTEFISELNVKEKDIVVTKHRYDAFHNTNLEQYLTANDISEILVCGIATNICVESTVRSAYNRDYNVTTISDCVGAADEHLHDAALENMNRFFGGIKPSTAIDLSELETSKE